MNESHDNGKRPDDVITLTIDNADYKKEREREWDRECKPITNDSEVDKDIESQKLGHRTVKS